MQASPPTTMTEEGEKKMWKKKSSLRLFFSQNQEKSFGSSIVPRQQTVKFCLSGGE